MNRFLRADIIPILRSALALLLETRLSTPCLDNSINICDYYFGEARQSGSSHRIYKTPWQGDPRVNIQNDKGMAKVYQVKQVLKAIERLEAQENVAE
jgi:hypothetical protein